MGMKLITDVKLLQALLKLPDTSSITEYAAQQDMNTPPGLYFKEGAEAQLAADLAVYRKRLLDEAEWQTNELKNVDRYKIPELHIEHLKAHIASLRKEAGGG